MTLGENQVPTSKNWKEFESKGVYDRKSDRVVIIKAGLTKTALARSIDANPYRVWEMLPLLERAQLIKAKRKRGRRRYFISRWGMKWVSQYNRLTSFLHTSRASVTIAGRTLDEKKAVATLVKSR